MAGPVLFAYRRHGLHVGRPQTVQAFDEMADFLTGEVVNVELDERRRLLHELNLDDGGFGILGHTLSTTPHRHCCKAGILINLFFAHHPDNIGIEVRQLVDKAECLLRIVAEMAFGEDLHPDNALPRSVQLA